ncbi:MAG: hypothetical protein OIN88_07240 [Candidatus Methanoperedens sp.]|nr:hypothetical protein [Candidatus Methanoperedens sp.]
MAKATQQRILIKNMNTTKLGSTYAFPNTPYKYDIANLPGGYNKGDMVQISVCRDVQNCFASRNIIVDVAKD